MSRTALALVVACAASTGLVAVNTAAELCRTREDQRWRRMTRRYWEDMYYAIGHSLTGQFPRSYLAVRRYRSGGEVGFREARPTLTEAASAAHIQPWEFWRTVELEQFLRRRRPPPFRVRFDDAGRPLLLSALFGVLGGVSPFLIHWLGFLFYAPVLVWLGLELHRVRLTGAACLAALLLGTSAYLADALALSYAAIGFYVLALLVLMAFAVYTAFARVTAGGLALRALLAGLAVGLFAVMRASALLPVFALGLALCVGAGRHVRERPAPLRARVLRWLGLVGLGGALLVTPYLLAARSVDGMIDDAIASADEPVPEAARQPQRHAFWFGVWVGLGDFDRERGYVWNDRAAFQAAERRGGRRTISFLYDSRNEPILRDMVLADVLGDPLWYAEILVKRLAATLTLWRILPWTPVSGTDFRESQHPNEGYVDAYYTLTATADRLRLGELEIEIPLLALMIPTWLLVAAAPFVPRLRPHGVALGIVAAGALALPVGITTASAVETQAFFLVYALGFSLAVHEGVRRLRRGAGGQRPPATLPDD